MMNYSSRVTKALLATIWLIISSIIQSAMYLIVPVIPPVPVSLKLITMVNVSVIVRQLRRGRAADAPRLIVINVEVIKS
jgi:hypothetical protein